MSKEESKIGGCGYRITESVNDSSLFGNDKSYTVQNDYGRHGSWSSGVKTDHNGDQWNINSAGCTTHKIGNDGRNK